MPNRLGSKPYKIVTIDGTGTFSETDGDVISISALSTVTRVDNKGSGGSVTVVLSAITNDLLNNTDIINRKCTITQAFLDSGDTFLIFDGRVASPIVWSEGERTITFEVLSKIFDLQAGFSPEEGQLPYLQPEFVGQPWPMGFGTPINVPATKITLIPTGSTASIVGVPDATIPLRLTVLGQYIQNLKNIYQYYNAITIKAQNLARQPFAIASDYIDAILNQNESRQTLEDMISDSQLLQDQINQLQELRSQAIGQDSSDIQSHIDELVNEYSTDIDNINQLNIQLQQTVFNKQVLQSELNSAEYGYQTIRQIITLMEDLILKYTEAELAIAQINYAISNQSKLQAKTIHIVNGNRFPQGKAVKIIINGVAFIGRFNDRIFTIDSVTATYSNIEVTPITVSQNINDISGLSSFQINSDVFNINGMYCLLGNGYIIHVNEQVGAQCRFELVKRTFPSPTIHNVKVFFKSPSPLLDATYFDQFSGSMYHTRNEQERIIKEAITDPEAVDEIQGIYDRITELQQLIGATPSTEDKQDIGNAVSENVSYLHQIFQNLILPEGTELELEKPFSDDDYGVLLRLQTLGVLRKQLQEEALVESIFGTIVPNIRQQYLVTTENLASIVEASPIILPHWINTINQDQRFNMPGTNSFIAQIGSNVKLFSTPQEKFVANTVPSTLLQVSAYRGLRGQRRLTPVPSRYYKSDIETLGTFQFTSTNLDCLVITLKRPLTDYEGEGWEDGLYVTYQSSIGPNVQDIIAWLLSHFSRLDPLQVVSTSGDQCNFALLDKRDVIQLCQDIAWQCRCALFLRGNIPYLTYLATQPGPSATVTFDDIVNKTLYLEATSTDDIVTRFIAEWNPSYEIPRPVRTIIQHNFAKYGVQERTYNFFVFNTQAAVVKSAIYWSIRYSNTFKRVKFATFLQKLGILVFDWITTPYGLGLVEVAQFNPETNHVDFECWLPILLGTNSLYNFAFPADVSITTIYPTIPDILSGNAGNQLSVIVPQGDGFSLDANEDLAAQFSAIDFSPPSAGVGYPSDGNPVANTNPSSAYNEQDYSPATIDQNVNSSINASATIKTDQKYLSTPNRTKELRENEKLVGVVISQNKDADVNPPSFTDSAGAEYTRESPYYDIALMNGVTVTARQLQLNSKSVIPANTYVEITFDKSRNEYIMQLPVWLSSSPTPVSSTQITSTNQGGSIDGGP